MISIITPSYNRLFSLKKCIESVSNQYFEGLEFIIIDDCSSDDTPIYLENISSSYIKIIINEENKGVNFSRNRGIDLAGNKFILFLDSDDELVDGCLLKILATLKNNESNKHFLFPVSYRLSEFNNFEVKEVYYEDWLKNTITGDFTHVVSTEIMKKYLFFEEFRLYEYLNWLRIKKVTSPQLMFPFVAVDVDRSSSDSLIQGGGLTNFSSVQSKFESLKLFYQLYHEDLIVQNPKSLRYKLLETVILGTSCNQKSASKLLLRHALGYDIKIIGYLATFFPANLLLQMIFKYSTIKRKIK